MDDATRKLLRDQRVSLEALSPYSWDAIETWRTRVRPLLVHVLPQQVEGFDEVTRRPHFIMSPRLMGSRGNNFAQAAATDEAANRKIMASAQQAIVAFLDTLLGLPTTPSSRRNVVVHNYGEAQMGDKYTTSITGSNVGAAAIGPGATASGTATAAAAALSQEQHRQAISRTQAALIDDQDALDRLDAHMFEALNQFLRLAREIQVEQKGISLVQAKMKETLDEVWAEQTAKGMKPQLLPKTLEIAGAIATNPVMIEVAKKLIGA